MNKTAKYNFGPGSLEDLELKVWTAKRDVGDGRQLRLSLKGTFRVYCGYGSEHTQEIDLRDGAWECENGEWTQDIIAARNGDDDAAFKLATTLVQMELDDVWEDPCESWDEVA